MEYPFSSDERETLDNQGAFEAVRAMIRNRVEEIDDMRGFREDVSFDRQRSLHNVIAYVRAVASGMASFYEHNALSSLSEEEAQVLLEEAGATLTGEVIGFEELCRREEGLNNPKNPESQ